MAITRALTVILFLIWIPFGKFFHIVQRPLQLGVDLYRIRGASGEQAVCPHTGAEFASKMQVDDLKVVTRQLGFNFDLDKVASRPESAGKTSCSGKGAPAGAGKERNLFWLRHRMAKLPVPAEQLIETFGPHLNFPPAGGFAGRDEPDRVVATHCCFCGMQCGIKLVAKNNTVIGFEPWEEFPFNQGRLCPKGVQRYLQNNHPDRLRNPLQRREGAGFEPISWPEAMERTVGEIGRIQKAYGRDSFALLSGVSLTNEKSYLNGKFARVALKTKNLD